MENITSSTVYWVMQIDDIKVLLSVIAILSMFGVGILLFAIYGEGVEVTKRGVSTLWSLFVAAGLLLIGVVFIPSTKTLCMMRIVPAIANSEIAKDLPKDTKELYRDGVLVLKRVLAEEIKVE